MINIGPKMFLRFFSHKKVMRIVLFSILGVLFRIWLIQLVPQPFIYDQLQYFGFAQSILKKGFHADSYRLYGYPIVLAPFIFLFGPENMISVKIFQAILDTITALFVFLMAEKLWQRKKISWICFILYLFNPFTSAYTGVLKTEVLAIFLMVLIFYLLLIIFTEKKLSYYILLVLLLGYLPQVKPSFVFFTLAVFLFILWQLLPKLIKLKDKIKYSLLLAIIFILPFTYNLVANLTNYGELNLLSLDNSFVRELYAAVYIERAFPISVWYPPHEVNMMFGEYSNPYSKKHRRFMTGKYFQLALQGIKKDPATYTKRLIRRMWYVWEKHYIYYYTNGPNYQKFMSFVYWGNIALLSLFLFGLVVYLKNLTRKTDYNKLRFCLVVICLVIYICLVHTLSTAEERFSLPAYPFVFLFAGYAVYQIVKKKVIL